MATLETRPRDSITAAEVRAQLGLDAPPVRRWRRLLWPLVLLFLCGGLGAFALARRRHDEASTRYVTAAITRGDLEVTITATGTVETMRTIQVGSEVSGRLQSVLAEANDRVKKGQLLAVIDPEQLRASVSEGQAQILASEAAVVQARATLTESRAAAARARKQSAEGLASQKDLESALATAARSEAAVQSALANVALGRATLSAARSKLDRATVVSPVDGVVLSRLVEVGQTVTAGFSTPVMFNIAEDLTQMRLEVNIDEADVGRAKEGQRASFTVEAYPERAFPSKLTSLRFNPTTSSNVVTYKAVLSADNHALLLRPGMTATATIITETKQNVLLVPNAALRFMPPKQNGPGSAPQSAAVTPARGERGVFVVDGDHLRRIVVKVGASDGVHSELVGDALTSSTKVVVDLQGGP